MCDGVGKRGEVDLHLLSAVSRSRYRRNNHRIKEITMLTTTVVVIGTYNLTWGLSTTMSPGRRPRGSDPSHGQRIPAMSITRPVMIRIRCMGVLSVTILPFPPPYTVPDDLCQKVIVSNGRIMRIAQSGAHAEIHLRKPLMS